MCNGNDCPHLSEIRNCNRACCPVDCVYSWGSWSTCQGSCGPNGVQTSLLMISQQESCGNKCNTPSIMTRKQNCDIGK